MSIDDFSEKYRLAGIAWAKKDGEARTADRIRKHVFSELVNQSEGAVSAREHGATCHPKYKQAVMEAERLRTEANILKAEIDAMQLRFEAWRTRSATKRAEMKLL